MVELDRYRVGRDVQDLGDLGARETFLIPEEEGDALRTRQPEERGFESLSAFKDLRAGRPEITLWIEVQGLEPPALEPPPAQEVSEPVLPDPEDPVFERPRRVIGISVAPGMEERVLKQVLCQTRIARGAQEETVERPRLAAHEVLDARRLRLSPLSRSGAGVLHSRTDTIYTGAR